MRGKYHARYRGKEIEICLTKSEKKTLGKRGKARHWQTPCEKKEDLAHNFRSLMDRLSSTWVKLKLSGTFLCPELATVNWFVCPFIPSRLLPSVPP